MSTFIKFAIHKPFPRFRKVLLGRGADFQPKQIIFTGEKWYSLIRRAFIDYRYEGEFWWAVQLNNRLDRKLYRIDMIEIDPSKEYMMDTESII